MFQNFIAFSHHFSHNLLSKLLTKFLTCIRGETQKCAPTWYQTCNHKVTSLIHLPLNCMARPLESDIYLVKISAKVVFLYYKIFYYIPSSEILEFPSVINFDIITSDHCLDRSCASKIRPV